MRQETPAAKTAGVLFAKLIEIPVVGQFETGHGLILRPSRRHSNSQEFFASGARSLFCKKEALHHARKNRFFEKMATRRGSKNLSGFGWLSKVADSPSRRLTHQGPALKGGGLSDAGLCRSCCSFSLSLAAPPSFSWAGSGHRSDKSTSGNIPLCGVFHEW
jgi:hypothetical protein